ncbi:MAG: hypothetical protein WBX25_07940 [Rhodomicrobium sp.]
MHDTCHRLLITIAILFAWRLGSTIPIPGLTLQYHNTYTLSSWHVSLGPEYSILKFGVGPIFSVLIVTELLRVASPAFSRWAAADRGGRGRLRLYVLIASLVLATVQALRFTPFYERLAEQPGVIFEVTLVVSLVAGTALSGWLAHLITIYGIGNGFWIFFCLPIITGLSKNIWLCLDIWWESQDRLARVWWFPSYVPTPAELGLLGAGLSIVAIFPLIFILLPWLGLRQGSEYPPEEGTLQVGGGLMESVWPPILATSIASWLVPPILAVLSTPTSLTKPAFILTGAVLIPLTTILREKRAEEPKAGDSTRGELKPVATLALVQTGMWATSLLWIWSVGALPLWDSYSLIIAITFGLDLAERLSLTKQVKLHLAPFV